MFKFDIRQCSADCQSLKEAMSFADKRVVIGPEIIFRTPSGTHQMNLFVFMFYFLILANYIDSVWIFPVWIECIFVKTLKVHQNTNLKS